MSNLVDALSSPEKKAVVVADCLTLIDQEVADKGGISGLAIKAGYAAVKGVKPGFIQNTVADLLPEFAKAVEPLYAEAKSKSEPVAAYFAKHAGRAADLLLALTDGKAERSTHGIVKGTYGRLRPSAKKNVEQAMPRLGRLIEKHAG